MRVCPCLNVSSQYAPPVSLRLRWLTEDGESSSTKNGITLLALLPQPTRGDGHSSEPRYASPMRSIALLSVVLHGIPTCSGSRPMNLSRATLFTKHKRMRASTIRLRSISSPDSTMLTRKTDDVLSPCGAMTRLYSALAGISWSAPARTSALMACKLVVFVKSSPTRMDTSRGSLRINPTPQTSLVDGLVFVFTILRVLYIMLKLFQKMLRKRD